MMTIGMETRRLTIEQAKVSDINNVIQLEEHPDNRDFLWVGTFEEHLREMRDPDHLLLVFRRKDALPEGDKVPGAPEPARPAEDWLVGYALVRLNRKSEIFELRRIAIDSRDKRKGYGREAMEALFAMAFEELTERGIAINRFWLDVYPDNEYGINLYESLGMHRDGCLRQNYKSERGYLDQIIYSMLREEYMERKKQKEKGK